MRQTEGHNFLGKKAPPNHESARSAAVADSSNPPQRAKFRRQHPAGPYVIEFYCPAAKLAIESDGAAHDLGDRPERDERRDHWLKDQGYRILRVPAGEVRADAEAVVQHIVNLCGR